MFEADPFPEKRLLLGSFAGLAAAIVGAILWAFFTVTTQTQIGFMALGVGVLVGFALRIGNGGKTFGILGAFLALFGCVLGNYFSLIAFASAEQGVGFFSMMNNADHAKVISAMWEDFTSISILFYALAAYEGYKFSAIRPSTLSSAPDTASQPQTAGVLQVDRSDGEKPR
ncbi:MAG TPA: hypothetical protein VFX07_01050 [Candidatus Udaeobacter sp.]|jgi:hypothetical protein|nr:hypothetical protein [Candidatus Udaeobacter sp.]